MIAITNTSIHSRFHQWVSVTIPNESLLPDEGTPMLWDVKGKTHPATTGKRLSSSVRLAHIYVNEINPNETLIGDLTWKNVPEINWGLSDWVARSQLANIKLRVSRTNETGETRAHELPLFPGCKITVQETGVARTVFLMRGRIPETPFVVDAYVYLYVAQDTVPFEIQVTNSYPAAEEYNFDINEIVLISGEYPRMWTGKRRGVEKSIHNDNEWLTRLANQTSFADGQGLAWYGSFLVQPTTGVKPVEPIPFVDADPNPRNDMGIPPLKTAQRFETLVAEYDSPLVGVYGEWRNSWGPTGAVCDEPKELNRFDIDNSIVEMWREHSSRMSYTGDPWDSVPHGLAKYPSSCGDQFGFGTCKHAMALSYGLNRARWLAVAQYTALHGEACRPVHQREVTGNPVQRAGHMDPLWICWDEKTHYSFDVSPDRLGKDEGHRWTRPTGPLEPPNSHGWHGRDRQHYQPLHEIGYYMLSGSYLSRQHLDNMCQNYLAGVSVPSEFGGKWVTTSGKGTARDVGRTLLSGCWLHWATGDEALGHRLAARVEEVISDMWSGKELAGMPVRVLHVHSAESRGPNGYDFWRPAFEMIGATGLYAVHKTTGLEIAAEIAYHVVKSVANHGMLNSGDGHELAWGVRYVEGGHALPESAYRDPEQVQTGGITLWGAAGFKVGIELAIKFGDEKLEKRCQAIFSDIESRYGRSSDPKRAWRYVEWTTI